MRITAVKRKYTVVKTFVFMNVLFVCAFAVLSSAACSSAQKMEGTETQDSSTTKPLADTADAVQKNTGTDAAPKKKKSETTEKAHNILGRATRLVLSCKDVIKNMSWWSRIGFVPMGAMDRPDSAMTLSDGQIVITLIKDPLPSPIVMFSTKDIRQLKDTLNELGIPITYDLKGPSYGEIRLISPNGVHLAVRSEQDEPVQRTTGEDNVITGKLTELSIGAAYLQREQQFWQTLGMVVTKSSLMPYPFANVNDGTIEIGLHENRDILTLAITYHSPDMKERIDRLKKSGIKFFEEIPSDDNVIENAILHSPDGQIVYMFKTVE
ncbi:MAG: hypothetical protein HQ472_05330 [Ignavibacteria bacterium]|nr:hypothetical protein [Ignavibacteria bacterium]